MSENGTNGELPPPAEAHRGRLVGGAPDEFFDWNGLGPLDDFVGLDNFGRALTDPAFLCAIADNAARILAFTALSMVPALAFFLIAERRMVGGLAGAVKG